MLITKTNTIKWIGLAVLITKTNTIMGTQAINTIWIGLAVPITKTNTSKMDRFGRVTDTNKHHNKY